MIKIFRKKPVEIQACEFTGSRENVDEIQAWASIYDVRITWFYNHHTLSIPTLEGNMTAKIGDFIIKGVSNEFYPCKPDIFKATYDEVGDS